MVQRICVSKKLKFVSAAKVGKSKMVGKEKCLRNASLFLNTNVLRASLHSTSKTLQYLDRNCRTEHVLLQKTVTNNLSFSQCLHNSISHC